MTTIARAASATETHNAGSPFDLAEILAARVDRSAAERRAATLTTRRTVKKEWQAAWLLRAVTCLDLTTLAGDDTPGNVRRLCAKARRPVRADLLDALGVGAIGVRVGAVCVYPSLVSVAVEALEGSTIPVASVAAGFPAGQTSLQTKVEEVLGAVRDGAREIDIVISRADALTGDWRALYDEVRELKQAAGKAHLKCILATGELGTLTTVARASTAALQAGADFIKTSTGKEPVNATLPVGLVMTRAIRRFAQQTGQKAGFKPAGGIRSAKQALDWLILIKEELGDGWLNADRFRIGASGLLTDIERQLSHHVTGRYSAAHYHPMV
ncbi:MAG: deoxyribose-phosphate aldolase [Dehalococcoidia bacterium]